MRRAQGRGPLLSHSHGSVPPGTPGSAPTHRAAPRQSYRVEGAGLPARGPNLTACNMWGGQGLSRIRRLSPQPLDVPTPTLQRVGHSRHSFSSLLSKQSGSPSHCQAPGMHRPLPHMKLPGMLHSLVKLFPGSSWLSAGERGQEIRWAEGARSCVPTTEQTLVRRGSPTHRSGGQPDLTSLGLSVLICTMD